MSASLSIGDFARATHLGIKTLRYYHRVGLLEPAEVDPNTGYRRYVTDQIPVAQVIRRFRDLEMPLEDIQAVLTAPDAAVRNTVVFVPCDLTFRATGRIDPLVIPGVELATTTHAGPHTDIDRSYGALATYVAHHAIGVEGPIREYYLIDSYTTADSAQWRTQIGWPIFRTTNPS
jgi:DNA-binding transcriptional MerR regulator